jgi:arabinofuranosyltransferase
VRQVLSRPDVPSRTARTWAWPLALIAPAAVALWVRLITGPHAIDDAYITFRYARNLAEGVGLVYNPGEWVLGTTAPLWALILAAGYKLGATDLPWLATVLSAFADALTAALLVRLARRMGWPPPGSALVGIAWAMNPMSIGFASGGMETSLFVLIALAVLTLAATRRYLPVAAAVCGLATFIRPEGGGLLAMTVVGWTFLRHRRQTLLTVIAAGIPLALGGVALTLGYGSPLPHSVAAKQVAYLPAWPLENAAALLIQAGLPGWSTYFLAAVPTSLGLLIAVIGLTTLAVVARRGILRLHADALAWQPFAGFAVLYFAFYVAVGLRGVRLFPWYLVPIEPFYLLAAAAGLWRLRPRGSWPHLAWLAPAALVMWQLPAANWRQPLLPAGLDLGREQLYLSVGQDLANTLPADAVIAAPEIGALGYASNLAVLDTVGLISPAAVPYYPLPADQLVTDNAIPARLIADRQPEAVVTLDVFAERSLLPDEHFQHDYTLEAEYPASAWESHKLLVFRRLATQ